MAAKIRHIAFRVEDIGAMAEFFSAGFGMNVLGTRPNGAVDLSDGTINITLLPTSIPGGSHPLGIDHLGFTSDNDDEARKLIAAAGGVERNTVGITDAHYEVKFEGPEGVVVDLGHWVGTASVVEEAIAAH